jgi:two-component system nitrate/nitrite response regulator NarL
MTTKEQIKGHRVLVVSRAARSERWVDALREKGYVPELAEDAGTGLERLEGGSFDLLVWDTEAPGPSAEDAIERGRLAPGVPAILILPRSKGTLLAAARRPGLLDFVVKPVDADALLEAMDEALALVSARRIVGELRRSLGHVVATLAELEDLLERPGRREAAAAGGTGGRASLSAREEELARALARGHRVSEIAEMYGISQHTVRNHFKAMFRKLDVHSQVQLLAKLRSFTGDAMP